MDPAGNKESFNKRERLGMRPPIKELLKYYNDLKKLYVTRTMVRVASAQIVVSDKIKKWINRK